MISPDTSGILVDGFEGGASCDCILKTDGATHRKSFPSCALLWWEAQESALRIENQIYISARIGIALKTQA